MRSANPSGENGLAKKGAPWTVRVARDPIHGADAGNDLEEHALCFETADGVYYVMVTGSPTKAVETLRSLGFASGRPRSGGRDAHDAGLYVLLVLATLLWLAVVSQLIRRLLLSRSIPAVRALRR